VKADSAGVEEELDRDVVIYSMPERFRFSHVHASNARGIGGLILLAGIAALAVLGAVFYYLLVIKKPAVQETVAPANDDLFAAEKKEEKKEEPKETATTTEPAVEIKETASTTAAALTETIASSTKETATTTEAETSPIKPAAPGSDTDGDGLTDKEETIFGSSNESGDTDGDGHGDLAEVAGLYNPAGSGKLIDNKAVKEYKNKAFSYSFYYPAGWTATEIGGDDSVIIKSEDNQFIQIIAQANQKIRKIEDWYREQFGLSEIDQSKKIAGDGWEGVRSDDGLIVYATDAERQHIFAVTYTLGESRTIDYANIFNLVLKSLKVETND